MEHIKDPRRIDIIPYWPFHYLQNSQERLSCRFKRLKFRPKQENCAHWKKNPCWFGRILLDLTDLTCFIRNAFLIIQWSKKGFKSSKARVFQPKPYHKTILRARLCFEPLTELKKKSLHWWCFKTFDRFDIFYQWLQKFSIHSTKKCSKFKSLCF